MLELGEVLCEATDHAVSSMDNPKSGQILRKQNHDDVGELRRLLEQQEEEHKLCVKHIAELSLDMRLVDVEHIYGGERVVVYYLADDMSVRTASFYLQCPLNGVTNCHQSHLQGWPASRPRVVWRRRISGRSEAARESPLREGYPPVSNSKKRRLVGGR